MTRRSLGAFTDLLFEIMKSANGDPLTLWRNVYDRLIALGWDDVAGQLISTPWPLGLNKAAQQVEKAPKHGNQPWAMEGNSLSVWCKHCRRSHGRSGGGTGCTYRGAYWETCTCPVGSGDGHRARHCHDAKSPYDVTGYIAIEDKCGSSPPQVCFKQD